MHREEDPLMAIVFCTRYMFIYFGTHWLKIAVLYSKKVELPFSPRLASIYTAAVPGIRDRSLDVKIDRKRKWCSLEHTTVIQCSINTVKQCLFDLEC